MKLIHISDLHLGKSLHGISLAESGDQDHWIDGFLEKVSEVRPDAILIAGDVFDRSAPSERAVSLFGRMLTRLNEMGIPVMTVAGNHDSGQRLSYLSPVLSRQGLYFSGSVACDPILNHITLKDDSGPVTFWMMPYVFPALISKALDIEGLRDYGEAVRELLDRQPVDTSKRNVLIAHQYVTAAGEPGQLGGSESMAGGIGQIDVAVFEDFDYVALGHIHAAYPVGRPSVRYSGSPLCYHFDEVSQQQKGPLLVELGGKGEEIKTEVLTIEPLHPMRDICGDYETIRTEELESAGSGEYIRIVLKDRRVDPEVSAFFHDLYREKGSILMDLRSDFTRYGAAENGLTAETASEKSPGELFSGFYSERRGGEEPDDRDLEIMSFADEILNHADVHAGPVQTEIDSLVEFLLGQEAKK